MNAQKNKVLGLTATAIFESSSVNRDEKIGENITSIKKIVRQDGTYSFMSRAFMRHHMFYTLNKLYGWQPAPIIKDKAVLQFDFPQANIINCPELDLFGFMRTSPYTVTRKAPLGMTKAISLEPWQGDMAFYANHDMVARAIKKGQEATPNPFSKEEHYTLYRITFTLDLYRFGQQELFINLKGSADDKESPAESAAENNQKKNKRSKKTDKSTEIDNWLEGFATVSANEVAEKVKRLSIDNTLNWYAITSAEDHLESNHTNQTNTVGYVGVNVTNDAVYQMRFLVTDSEYERRLKQVLTVIKNGFAIHSSTEDYGMVPLFCVIAALKVPVPVFHSSVNLSEGKIDAERLWKARDNDYILKAWYKSQLPLTAEFTDKFEQEFDADIVTKFICESNGIKCDYSGKEADA